ncbi:MAG: hypothetical protein RIG82_07375 [Phycisphaeraceae bacterium]
MLVATPHNHAHGPHPGLERLSDLTHALEDAVITVAEDRHAHRYMGQLAHMLGRVHELQDDSVDASGRNNRIDETPSLRLGVEELSNRTLWLQHNATAHEDDDLARAFQGLHQRLASLS